MRLLLVDNEDCFIHTLANYARQTGAEVVTYRAGFPLEMIANIAPSLILISPGPGRPADFGVPALVRYAARLGVPVFGVCLGLQGMVEAFGGELGVFDYPKHGKPRSSSKPRHRRIRRAAAGAFGRPLSFAVMRCRTNFRPASKLQASAKTPSQKGGRVIMGVRHRELPIEAVQFHPESILTFDGDCGLRLMENVVRVLGRIRAGTR